MDDQKIRLQKFMADAGIGSRRHCEELISQKLVKINDKMASIGDKVDSKCDKVTYNGKPVEPVSASHYTYIMLNKPKGYLSTVKDDRGRPTVMDLIGNEGKRLYPVGRLDFNSEGLLLLTDDGELTYNLTHPKNNKEKSYEITISGKITPQKLERLNQPFDLEGYKTAPAQVTVLLGFENKTVLLFVLHEGRNRQIRKMCEQTGLLIRRIRRISVDGLFLGDLPPGRWRYLSVKEIHKLMDYQDNHQGIPAKP